MRFLSSTSSSEWSVPLRIVLRMANEDDYLMLGVPKDVLSAAAAPGRGIIDDNEVHEISFANRVPPGGVGEIVVRGPTMSKRYYGRPEANRLGKILTHEGIWHRMGDLGRFDADGRLWYLGRKAHRVETGNGQFLPEPVEGIFNAHPAVRRSALVALVDSDGRRMAGVCIELRAGLGIRDWTPIRGELRQIGARHAITSAIRHFFLHPGFPVDIRHTAMIDRQALSVWA